MRLVEVFHDGKRLRELLAIVDHQRRGQALRINARVARRAVLAFRQVDELSFVGDALQVERDADAERGGTAKVRVKLHSAGMIFTLISPTPSMPACSSSPGLTGPTPAGVPE